jgi:alcohol dehydrogenase class IV
VQEAAASARDARADAIVTIGGGSVQDAGKFVRFQLSNMLSVEPILQFAIPTTLSGAEFTYLAGWTVVGPDGKPEKKGIADERLVPGVVLMDPEACRYTPRWLWASAGIRAVDHACEGITSRTAGREVEERCLTALRLLKESLPKSTADAADLSAAEACLRASHEASAGVNWGGAGAGLSHKLGKALGATWNIPHGVTSAITLPAVLAAEHQVQPERTKLIADALGARTAADGARDLIDACEVEHKPLSEYGVTPQDIPRIATYALGRRDAMVEALVLNLL